MLKKLICGVIPFQWQHNIKIKFIFFFPKSTSLLEMLANESYLDKHQDTEVKTLIHLIEEFKEFKGTTKKQLNGIKEDEF